MQSSLYDWLADTEKFAAIVLDVHLDRTAQIPLTQISGEHWVVSDAGFPVPEHWKEWLGTIGTERIERANLTLLSKVPARHPQVIDQDSKAAEGRAQDFYFGLVLATPFGSAGDPVLVSGAREDGALGMRSHSRFDRPSDHPFRRSAAISLTDLRLASSLASALTCMRADRASSSWRFLRVLQLYLDARTETDQLEQLHQFCRCIEGFILPDTGKTHRQFKSRTELFIGPSHHALMGRIYDARSAAEHLNEHILLDPFDREVRIDLIKQLAIAEYIARCCITRVLTDPALFEHFRTVTAQQKFWALAPERRRELWGTAINPLDALRGFNAKFISDRDLGKPEMIGVLG